MTSKSKIHNPLFRLGLTFFHNSNYSLSTFFEKAFGTATVFRQKESRDFSSAKLCKATMPTKKIKYFFINYPFNKKYLSLTGPLENNHIRMYTNM